MTETDTIATAAAATPATEEATDLAALAELTAQRSAVYRLLARLYRVEVDEEFLAELKTMRFPAATGNTAVDTGYRTIATYLSGADAHAITDLAVDYVRAFIGHGIDAYSAAYPFESVYTSPKRLMMQEARDEVLAVYRSEGLDKLPTWKEAEDHIALELEFMAALGDRIVAEQFGTGGELSAPDPEDDAQAARRGLAAAREAVLGGAFDVVVLDEANVADSLGYFEPDALVDLALERPETVELVVTGRGASGTLMAVADLVTEMREVKHYYEEGVIARRGIEF